jgi:hypothetical protein
MFLFYDSSSTFHEVAFCLTLITYFQLSPSPLPSLSTLFFFFQNAAGCFPRSSRKHHHHHLPAHVHTQLAVIQQASIGVPRAILVVR